MSSNMNSSFNTEKGIISWFARNSVAANLMLVGMIFIGFMSLSSIRQEAFPSLEPDRITVSVNYDSGDPEQAEEGIAIKIEDALETVAGIKRITSTSNANGSTVVIEKDSDYPLDDLLTDVKTNVDAIFNFPVEAENPVIDKARMQDHALWIQLYGNADRGTLQDLAERLKSDLLAKPAIKDLEIKAKVEPMISVEVDEGKLQAYNLTITDVSTMINNESSTAITTSLRNENKDVRLKVSQQAYELTDFQNIALVNNADGSRVTLGDIAHVEDTFEDDIFNLSRYNLENSMAIEIVMDEQGDISDIIEQAEQVISAWEEKGALPQTVKLDTWYDRSVLIKDRLALLVKNAVTGIALVFIILALFLNLRVAFWVAAGLPFVFFGTLFFMTDSFVALTLNELTTFGFIMALGIVVDDAVVIGESIYTTRREEGDTIESTIKGAQKVAIPTFFGVLTTVVAFLALSNVQGHLGQIYAQFAAVVTICLLLSVVESKLILPSHLAHLNTRKNQKSNLWTRIQHGADSSLQWFNNRIYRNVIELALRFRYGVLCLFIALFILVIGLPMSGAVRVGFFPDIPGDVVSAEISMQNDASFGQTQTNLLKMEQTALDVDERLRAKHQKEHGLENPVNTEIQSLQVIADSDSSGSVTVELDTESVYPSTTFTEQFKLAVGQLEGIQKLRVSSKMSMMDNFKVELKAWDDETVFAAGQIIKDKLLTIDGVSGIGDNLNLNEPQYRFVLNEQGRALGLDTASLSQQILQSFGGDIVQRFQRGKDEVKVRVRYPEEYRQTKADILQGNVRTPSGTVVPISSVADVFTDYQQSEITRIDSLRAAFVSAELNKDIVASNELVDLLKAELVPYLETQYPDLVIKFAGEAEEQQETTSSMSSMFLMALVGIYALLAIPLKSYIQPILIMTAIPFGIVGAILGHWLNDITLSVLSLNGILALSGVVVNDSLLLVSRFNEIIKEAGKSVHDAIVEACTGRLRAVLLTSVTTFAGLAPLLSETSMQAQFLKPAAAALGYGILFATVITLILIPSLLYIQYEFSGIGARIKLKLRTYKETVFA